jgi:hypothetical protein
VTILVQALTNGLTKNCGCDHSNEIHFDASLPSLTRATSLDNLLGINIHL